MIRQTRAFVLQEVMLAVVVLALAFLPFYRALHMLPEVAHVLGEQSRLESWRSLAEETVCSGLDPNSTEVLAAIGGAPAKMRSLGTVSRHALAPRAGAAQVVVLRNEFLRSAEGRLVGGGFEIGASTLALPPRTDLMPPLAAGTRMPPILSPASGTWFGWASLSAPSESGRPFEAQVGARGAAPEDDVHVAMSAPDSVAAEAAAAAVLTVDATQLARTVRGRAWSEFAGNPSIDQPIALEDGRRAWLTLVAGGRRQMQLPSDYVDFVYGIDVGRPVYRIGVQEYASGESISTTYLTATSIAGGGTTAAITYPSAVRARFGAGWDSLAPRYEWDFGGALGDTTSGVTTTIYTAEGRAGWKDATLLTARPKPVASGMTMEVASWSLERTKLTLGAPARSGDYYDPGDDAPGELRFVSPELSPAGARIGRPMVNGVEGLSDEVFVEVIP